MGPNREPTPLKDSAMDVALPLRWGLMLDTRYDVDLISLANLSACQSEGSGGEQRLSQGDHDPVWCPMSAEHVIAIRPYKYGESEEKISILNSSEEAEGDIADSDQNSSNYYGLSGSDNLNVLENHFKSAGKSREEWYLPKDRSEEDCGQEDCAENYPWLRHCHSLEAPTSLLATQCSVYLGESLGGVEGGDESEGDPGDEGGQAYQDQVRHSLTSHH